MQTIEDAAPTETWVAIGPAGVVGAVHRSASGYRVELFGHDARTAWYPSLASAKRAVHAAMGPNAERPEFHAH